MSKQFVKSMFSKEEWKESMKEAERFIATISPEELERAKLETEMFQHHYEPTAKQLRAINEVIRLYDRNIKPLCSIDLAILKME